jgi:predicted alpha/beta-hydrolase family hydrolase
MKVTALLAWPSEVTGPAVLLAHGAGAGQQHPFMAGLRTRLAAGGLPAMTFEYPYMSAGRRAPDRAPTLLACHAAAMERLLEYTDRVVLAGKSMGGRMATHLAVDHRPAAVVVYGYPLVPIGKAEPRPTEHLAQVTAPVLFLQGSRDRLAPLELLQPVAEQHGVRLQVIDDADHGFGVPKRTGLGFEDVLDLLAAETVAFVESVG